MTTPPRPVPRVPSGPVVGVVLVGLAMFLAITITAGLLIWDDAPTGAVNRGTQALGGADPGSAEPRPSLSSSRAPHARIGPAALVLPDDPYVVHPDPLTLDGVFDYYFWASALRHRATTVGATGPRRCCGPAGRRVRDRRPGVDGRFVVDQLSRSFFDGHPVEVRQLNGADHAVDGHPGMLFTAAVHYAVPNLPRHGSVPGPAGRRLGAGYRHDGAERHRSGRSPAGRGRPADR